MRILKKRSFWLGGLLVAVALSVAVYRADRLRMTSKVYAWFPDGVVKDVSPEVGTYYQSCIHPKGKNVIFAGAETGPPRIYQSDFATGHIEPITPPDTAAFLATYSWDGSRIVFSSDRDFEGDSVGVEEILDPRLYRPGTRNGRHYRYFNLYVMDADGGNVRRITEGEHRDLRGSFSPDGTEIVFYSDRSFDTPLWIIAADGSTEARPIVFEGDVGWYAFRPWYSLDGETVYFFGSRRGMIDRKRVVSVPAAGGLPQTIPWDDRGKTQGPFVDPSGDFLLFHNNRTGRSELWEYPLPDGEPRMLVPPFVSSFPEEREVMHPTRSANGIITFDVSVDETSRTERILHSLHHKGLRGFWRLRRLVAETFGLGGSGAAGG